MLAEFHLQTERSEPFTIKQKRALKANTMHFCQPLKAGVSESDETANPKRQQRASSKLSTERMRAAKLLLCVFESVVLWVAVGCMPVQCQQNFKVEAFQ